MFGTTLFFTKPGELYIMCTCSYIMYIVCNIFFAGLTQCAYITYLCTTTVVNRGQLYKGWAGGELIHVAGTEGKIEVAVNWWAEFIRMTGQGPLE